MARYSGVVPRSALAALVAVSSLVGVGLVRPSPALAAVPFHLAWVRVMPAHVGRSAPVATVLGPSRTPAVVVGDQAGYLHGFALAGGSPVPGWGALKTSARSIDAALSSDGNRVYVPQSATRNNATMAAYSLTGARLWAVHPCPATTCDSYSGMTVRPDRGGIYTGGRGQYIWGIRPANGTDGWKYLNSDTTNSTPAVADLYGSGPNVITTNDQTPNAAVGALSGGHLRIFTAGGAPLCDANIGGGPASPGSFDSSPAVASFGAAPVIVFGSGASGTLVNRMVGYNAACQRIWVSPALAGRTVGAPAIADVTGSGRPVVLELVSDANRQPVVYELDGLTGLVIRSTAVRDAQGRTCGNFVQGTASSVVTADLTSSGHQDLLVPAGSCGVVALDGRTLARLGQLGASCAVQNTPVATRDPNGQVGITMAGYRARVGGGSEGCVFHYTVAGGALGRGGWPSFHHDSQLTGTVTAAFNRHDALVTGGALPSGASLVSANGQYRATMQTGGTFAVYYRSSSRVRWQKVAVSPGARLVVDGTMAAARSVTGATLWHTPSYRETRPLTLVLSPSGQLALYVHSGNQWAATQRLWWV